MRRLFNFGKRIWAVIDDRTGISDAVAPLLYHKVPPDIGWPYVLGSATLVAFIVQIVTGIALASAYVPSTADAYASLQFITHQTVFGRIMRGMHFFGASAMVVLISLHTIRTFLYGAYKFPREANWMTGVILLGLTMMMAWTGQLLRWDETGVWTVVVGAHTISRLPLIGESAAQFMLAGETVGGPTLSRFFVFHILFLPLSMLALIGFHIYLVVRNGISEPPEPGRPVEPATYRRWYHEMLEKRGLPFWPYAAWRDAVFGLLVVGVVVALALIVGPMELGGPPDPSRVLVEPQPDWYFQWYDALVTLTHPNLEYVVMLGLPLLAGLILFLLPILSNRGERSFWKRPWAIMAVFAVVMVFTWLTLVSRQPHLIPEFDVEPLPVAVVGASSGPVAEGAYLYYEKACLNCHAIAGHGGLFGPDLTYIADRLNRTQIELRILNGTPNMPAYLDALTVEEFNALMAFLETRHR